MNKEVPKGEQILQADSFDLAFLLMTGRAKLTTPTAVFGKVIKQLKDVRLWGPEAAIMGSAIRRAWRGPGAAFVRQVQGAFDVSGEVSVDSAKIEQLFRDNSDVGQLVWERVQNQVRDLFAGAQERAHAHFAQQRAGQKAKKIDFTQAQWDTYVADSLSDKLQWAVETYPGRVLHSEVQRLVHVAQTNPANRLIDVANLKDRIAVLNELPETYLHGAADLHVGRVWSYTGLQTAVQNNVSEYAWVAVWDTVTCPVCETLAGKTFSVARTYEQVLHYLDSDPSQDGTTMPFPRREDFDNKPPEAVAELGYSPPAHGRCRCDIVFLWESESVDISQMPGAFVPETLQPGAWNGTLKDATQLQNIFKLRWNMNVSIESGMTGGDMTRIVNQLNTIGADFARLEKESKWFMEYADGGKLGDLKLGMKKSGGYYDPGDGSISLSKTNVYGFSEGKSEQFKSLGGRFSVTETTSSGVWRHELGHKINFEFMDEGTAGEWVKVRQAYSKKFWEGQLSKYSTTVNEYWGLSNSRAYSEFFAENMAAWTSPFYGTPEYRLVPQLESFFQKHFPMVGREAMYPEGMVKELPKALYTYGKLDTSQLDLAFKKEFGIEIDFESTTQKARDMMNRVGAELQRLNYDLDLGMAQNQPVKALRLVNSLPDNIPGRYNAVDQSIEISLKTMNAEVAKLGTFNIGGTGTAPTLRHTLGHAIQESMLTEMENQAGVGGDLHNLWVKYGYGQGLKFAEKNIGKYAMTSEKEFFAEIFNAFGAPKYGVDFVLPDQIDFYLKQLFKSFAPKVVTPEVVATIAPVVVAPAIVDITPGFVYEREMVAKDIWNLVGDNVNAKKFLRGLNEADRVGVLYSSDGTMMGVARMVERPQDWSNVVTRWWLRAGDLDAEVERAVAMSRQLALQAVEAQRGLILRDTLPQVRMVINQFEEQLAQKLLKISINDLNVAGYLMQLQEVKRLLEIEKVVVDLAVLATTVPVGARSSMVEAALQTEEHRLLYRKYEQEYIDFLQQIKDHPNQVALLRKRYVDDIGETAYKGLQKWQGSTHNEAAMALKTKAAQMEPAAGRSVLFRQSVSDSERLNVERIAKRISDDQYLRMRAFNQSMMMEKGQNVVTLLRGTDGGTGRRIVDAILGLDSDVTDIVIHDANLAGYSTNLSIAKRFGSSRGGVVVRAKFVREQIFVTEDLLYKITGEYGNEREWIVFGGQKVYPLKDVLGPSATGFGKW